MNGNPSATTTDRVMLAVREQAERIDGVRYGTVVVEVQDGKVVLLSVTEKYKSIPFHAEVGGCLYDGDGYHANCRCGASFTSTTYRAAKAQLEAHIANSK